MIKKFSVPSFLMGLLCSSAIFGLGLYLFSPNENEISRRELALALLSRADVGKVEMYEDTSIMHGPIYFYFESDDTDHFAQWLKLKAQKEMPRLFKSVVKHAQSEVKWPFNWETQNIYAIFYCGKEHYESASDMLLVDGRKVVYMTAGVPYDLKNIRENPC